MPLDYGYVLLLLSHFSCYLVTMRVYEVKFHENQSVLCFFVKVD